MSDEIEQRLAAAAAAARESQLCRQQHAQLKACEYAAQEDLEAAQQQCAGQEKAVEQLEHLSLTRVLAALHGARADSLAREQAQAEAARYQVTQAQQRLRLRQKSFAGSRQSATLGRPVDQTNPELLF